jgi:NAD+ synthase
MPPAMDIRTALTLDSEREADRIVRFVRRQLARAGRERVIFGLSGGIDSALTCLLCQRAFGADRVVAMALPHATSDPASEGDARLLADQLGIKMARFDITPMVEAMEQAYPEMGARRRGNIMARCRMMVLYDQSEAHEALVVGSSNRTEMLLGYFTLYADNAAAFRPLAHLYKCQVRQLARHLGAPEVILTKAPSADLWAGQTDEGELGFTYDEADQILYLLTECECAPAQVVERGYSQELVDEVWGRMHRSAFKRREPPSLSPDNPCIL